jgi:hypothetical protein
MIPLSIFLIPWAILLLIHVLLSLVSVIQMLRFGMSGSMASFSTALFLIVSAMVILATVMYFLSVDWSLSIEFGMFSKPGYITL